MAAKMFVLISHTGDYDDYRTSPVMVSNHKHVLEAHAVKLKYENALMMHVGQIAAQETYNKFNPDLKEISTRQPKFDRSRHQEKGYQKEYMAAKQAWQDDYNKLCTTINEFKDSLTNRLRSEVKPEEVNLATSTESFTVEEVDLVNEMPEKENDHV
mgnify:CR=1 FL=1